MSNAYDTWENQFDSKYQESDKKVCSACLNSDSMNEFITKNGQLGPCDFCGNEELCISVNIILNRFMDFVGHFYEDAAESSPVDHGEYVFATVDMHELIDEYLDFLNANLLEHVHECFRKNDTLFCDKINNFGNDCMEHFKWSWNDFSEQLKHQMRFFFWNEDDSSLWNDMPPYKILYDIAEGLYSLGFIKNIPSHKKLYRARPLGEYSQKASELGAPPPEIAPNNRMSPAGISFFYASQDEKTCLYELNLANDQSAVIGKWETCRDMLFLDLSKCKLPGFDVFDTEHLNRLPFISFFSGFVRDVSRTINQNTAGYDYVPTQVLSEFFRCIYRTPKGERLSGIIYPSSKLQGGINYAIFCGQKECLPGQNQWLSLIPKDVKTLVNIES